MSSASPTSSTVAGSTARGSALPVVYDGMRIDGGYRIDLLVNGDLIVEVKAVDVLAPVHTAQL